MSTDTEIDVEEKSSVNNFEKIWNNLVTTDAIENNFPFSTCRNRHIVVLNSHKTTNYIVGDIIRRNTYIYPYHQQRKEAQKTITYVMVQDDPSCNVCIINLIDIPPLDYFLKRIEKKSKDPILSSPMIEIDKIIYKFATSIDLIILVCEPNEFELMKNMTKWASNRGDIMALAFIVKPDFNSDERDEYLLSIRNDEKFREYQLDHFFKQGIFCLSDLSYSHFRNASEQKTAQDYVQEWRSKFLQICVGSENDKKYTIQIHDEKQQKTSFCNLL